MSVINIKLTDTPDPAPSGRRGIYINLAGQGRMVDSAGNTYPIAGEDGAEIELRVDGTNLQWRYVGDVSWITLIDLSTIGGSSSYPAATFRESNTVLFDGDYITGVNAAPRTGNILFDFTGAQKGAVTIMYHQDAGAFTFPTEAELNFDSGTDISTTKVNKFMMVLVDDTPSAEKVDVMVNWEGGTP